jgi:hypothetical protein
VAKCGRRKGLNSNFSFEIFKNLSTLSEIFR